MKRRYAWASILALTHVLLSTPLLASEVPVNVILDTDIGPDCDDVGALVVLHSLADTGEVNLLGVMCCTSSQWGAPCLDALNTYYGRPHIPVGTLKDAGFLDRGGYPEQIARRFPHRLKSGKDAPGAALYRDGVFTLTGGGMGLGRWWRRNWDQFALVSQSHDGDCAISARLTSQTKSSPGAIAGLVFRETTARESRFVAVGLHPSGELLLTWRDSSADENPRTKLGKVNLPIYLKLARRGNTFQADTSADGVTWGSPLGQHIGKSHQPSQKVGLWVTANRNPTTSTAQFEHVRVETDAKSR